MTQREKHMQAFEAFATRIKDDPNIIAFLLYGSLIYGTVSENSDIDVCIIVRDGSYTSSSHDWVEYEVDENGIDIHAGLYEITKFKRRIEKMTAGDWTRSQFGKGKLFYCKDDSLTDFMETFSKVGKDEAVMGIIRLISFLSVEMHRANKWITTLDDTLYAQQFLQKCSWAVSEIIVLLNGEHPDREAKLRAMELNPILMNEVYVIPSTTEMTKEQIQHTLNVLDGFLMEHLPLWSKPILDYFSDGEIRTSPEFNNHFGIEIPLGYLVSKGILGRVTKQSRLFKNSKRTAVDEIGYIYIKEEHNNV